MISVLLSENIHRYSQKKMSFLFSNRTAMNLSGIFIGLAFLICTLGPEFVLSSVNPELCREKNTKQIITTCTRCIWQPGCVWCPETVPGWSFKLFGALHIMLHVNVERTSYNYNLLCIIWGHSQRQLLGVVSKFDLILASAILCSCKKGLSSSLL